MWILSWILFQSFDIFFKVSEFFHPYIESQWCPGWVEPQSSSKHFCGTHSYVPQNKVWNKLWNRIFIFGWAIPLNPNGLLTFSRWTFVKRSRSSQSSQCLNSLKRSALDFHFHRGFLVIIFSCRFVFDRQLILLRESAKLQQPFNKVPLVLLNISLPALLFHMPPLFHALIKETEHERMKERVIKMRSESRFQPFVMNIP